MNKQLTQLTAVNINPSPSGESGFMENWHVKLPSGFALIQGLNEEDARYICRACNNHHALMDACIGLLETEGRVLEPDCLSRAINQARKALTNVIKEQP